MITSILAFVAAFSLFGHSIVSPLPAKEASKVLSEHQFSLAQRNGNTFVNDVFKDNILLNLAYLEGKVRSRDQINWDALREPFEYKFMLEPGQTFAFHDDVLEKYQGKVVKTTGAHFNFQEGFKSSGYLFGDGVCHLASLIYWTAKDAGLDAEAPTDHNFMAISEIPKVYGVAIYSLPGARATNARQNLYITNSRESPVEFRFDYQGNNLKITLVEKG
ncbi:VanW family protein [Candidatus Curtissbacteria bacterium]|nr:VanW family protein [Candidatus Curtissbacteria bacterium]